MIFEKQLIEMKKITKELLENKTVDLVIGFEESGLEGKKSPLFAEKPEEIDSMCWDNSCVQNLAYYLKDLEGKTAIIAKPCDTRAIVMYMKEGQINRENIKIIGVKCKGLVDAEGNPDPACTECDTYVPVEYDYLVDGDFEKEIVPIDEKEYTISRLKKELEKCILCYSCRQACYGCYCKVCFADREEPKWMPNDLDMNAKLMFHLGRVSHLAGRCVECGACERACPSDVNIRYLIREASKFCDEMYDYRAGLSLEDEPAMVKFDKEDEEIGFLKD